MVFWRKRNIKMAKRELTIKIPDDIFDEIERYRKSANKPNTEEAVAELIKYALSLPPLRMWQMKSADQLQQQEMLQEQD